MIINLPKEKSANNVVFKGLSAIFCPHFCLHYIACDVMRAVMLESKHNFITQLVSYALGYAPKWHLH